MFEQPPAISQAGPSFEANAITVWGDIPALLKLKAEGDRQHWTMRWAKGGTGAWLLFIGVDAATPKQDVDRFLQNINSKRYGDLSAGLSQVGK